MKKIHLRGLFFSGIAVCIICFFVFDLHRFFSIENIEKVKHLFIRFGFWTPLMMIGLYIMLNIAAIPRVFFTIFSGYIYGIFYGFIFAWIATLAGLAATFLLIRYLFLDSFEKRYGNRQLIETINARVDKYGIWLVIFLRAIYVVPSSVLNYSFGFTKIKTGSYLLGSAIGFVPVVLVNVIAGDALARGLEKKDATVVLIWALTILVLAFLLKKLLSKQLKLKNLIQ